MNATQLLTHFDRLAEAPDAVPRLRRFILDLAVRGKLVEQDAKDEPATALLRRINTAKTQRIKSGEIRNPREIDFADDEKRLFEVPSTWQWVRLADAGAVVGGGTPPSGDSSNFTDGGKGVGWLTPADLGKHRGLFIDHGARDLTRSGMDAGSATLMPPGAVLFTSRAPIGYVAIAANEISTNQGFKSVVPYLPECSRYIATYLQAFGPWIDSKATGTTFKEVSGKIVSGLPFPLPPLAEQHRIVAKVDELMALCDQLDAAQQERERRRDRLAAASLQRLNQPAEENPATDQTEPAEARQQAQREQQKDHARFHLQNLQRLTTRPEHIKATRQTIRNLAITGRLATQSRNDEPASTLLELNVRWRIAAIKRKQIRDPRKELAEVDHEFTPYELPVGWAWARIGEVIYIQSGDGLTAANMKEGSIPVFGGNGINGHHDAFNVEAPTLVIGRVGYYCGSIHITPERAWVTDNAFVTHFCPELFSLRFLALLLMSTNLKENEGATAQPVISGSKIYPIVVGVPPLAEQHRIVAKVDELMALCDQLEAQLTRSQTDSRRLLEAVLDAALAPA